MRLTRISETLVEQYNLQQLIYNAFQTQLLACKKIGEGAFGVVYDAQIGCSPKRVVLKIYKFPGWGNTEKRQLAVLRNYSSVRVPEVYYYQPNTTEQPCEAVVMERLPGISGKELGRIDPATRDKIAHNMVDALLALHSVRQPSGYGGLDGPYCPRWLDAYLPRLHATHAYLHTNTNITNQLPPSVVETADRSLALAEQILGDRRGEAVLLHSDYCLGNLLFDPHTYQITGLIDPLAAEWGDRELDTILLTKNRGHLFRLVELYQQKAQLDERFPLRYWFYMFWTWLYYYALIELFTPQWLQTCVQELDKAISEYL